ncbi:SusC/RagA family TonB-linked outer membrane protein [Imtechella halotolerans]|uniref:TonB-dependent receptor, plug n=1 Tax=Imtechella halotolerans K1 TaxID=946077 RepID=I0WI02_9FLAO|nr:TonB-dependent receptor [Imtechella halotolerans]EID76018.1 TonB-dependent receptor, plug [Imtechella halotolerans K1]WMQ63209.1 TonB-dependent receptor [Imtechella halotolerans]
MRENFKFLLVMFMSLIIQLGYSQEKRVSGAVTDQGGVPLPGVNVSVKGTSNGTQTDFDGKYSITVSQGQILVFSYIGMKTIERTVGAANVLNVALAEDTQALEEVVVVGYGVQRKRDVTGAITQVGGAEIASLASPSFESQLAGRAAGVQITTGNGVIGEAPRIRIRGIGSISSGTYPLIVVDGMPITTGDVGGYASTNALGDINPADIESMEILKDGSATAIYGSRAANGVILITTKKGKEGRMAVNYSNYLGVAKPVKAFDLLRTEDFITISNEKRSNRGQSPWASGNDFDTDWQDAVLVNNAFQQDHILSLNGGTEKTQYYASVGYTSQEGVTLANDMERFSMRTNVDQRVNDWLKLGASLAVTRTEYNGLNTGTNSLSGNIFSTIRQHPNVPIYNPNHPTGYNIDFASPAIVGRWDNNTTIGDNVPNIVYVLHKNVYNSKVNRTLANIYADIKLHSTLNFKTQINADESLTSGFLYWNPVHGDGNGSNGRVQNNQNNITNWNWQNILSYNNTFAEDHNVGLVLISEYQKLRAQNFSGIGTNLLNEFFNQNLVSDTYSIPDSGGGISENGIISFAGRFNYNYKNKYYVQGSLRRDGLSKLPFSNKYGTFPGISLGWTMSKENFMASLSDVVSDLKIRASYAEVGNTSIGNYSYFGAYGASRYADTNGTGYSQFFNPDLKWETSEKWDIGLDLSMFNNRLTFTFDWFKNNQNGLILAVPTPMSFGIPGNSYSDNIGSLVNKGLEFSIGGTAIDKGDLKWDLNANVSFVENEITELYLNQDQIFTNNIRRVGESMNALWGYRYWGVNSANGNPVYYKSNGTLVQGIIGSGVYRVFDPNNPGDISQSASLSSASDKQILGQVVPKYFGSLNSKMTYKNFDFGFMFRFSGGNKIFNATRRELMNLNFTNNGTEILGRWQSVENPGDGWTPKLRASDNTFSNLSSHATTRFVEKGDFIKLDNLNIGYTLPKSITEKISIDKMRVFVQGQNLWIISDYSGIDPEMENSGVDLNGTPRSSIFTVGFNVSL